MKGNEDDDPHCRFSTGHRDRLLDSLHTVIRQAVRVLSVLMMLVILLGTVDVLWVIYQRLAEPPHMLLGISDIFAIFGAFLVVLIAIEIFVNISLYLRDDVIHVKLVVATALMAIARKVIVLDYNTIEPAYVYATAATVLALGVTYWLVSQHART
ncbi:hypothetical protein E6C76_09270 [Pseudothauera nasutitermitis]|uniref:Uncharacterized protein n=2 Tax=Pseudothauera nasutitermitis TaxID=2565930 RepID=A0A4S4B0T3_9RHOO|nr:phosphate-starvation-inducible PsiE family protein [Pseudothauera nasutitermitis]THF65976.1 hypothetical protein E6C76_09270 [Pseudothauera nasutitermitis]